jgi:hypothetical protein
MKKLLPLFLLFASIANAKTVSTVVISPSGAALKSGSSIQFSAACTYTDTTSDSTCVSATSLTWAVSRPSLSSISGAGLLTMTAGATRTTSHAYVLHDQVVDSNGNLETCVTAGTSSASALTWPSRGSIGDQVGSQTVDGGVTWQQTTGYIDSTMVVVTAGGVSDKATAQRQVVGDTWYQYPTPDYTKLQTSTQPTQTQLPANVVVGSTVTIGSGVITNSSGPQTGTPFKGCAWLSSDTSKATVDTKLGLVTAIATGSVNITCGRNGDAVFGSSVTAGWQAPGNVITLTIVAGGTSNQTWYARAKGGSPYVNNTITPYGQCNGLSDADYPGLTGDIWHGPHAYALNTLVAENTTGHVQKVTTAGTSSTSGPSWNATGTTTDGTVVWTAQASYPVGQACAVGNLAYLYTDRTGYETYVNAVNPNGWMIRGGDTVIVRQNAAGYDIGQDNNGTFGGPGNCVGSAYGCFMPTIPSGTSARHTKILGENYGSCTADSAKTLLHETWGVNTAFNVQDSQFVDVACFEITDVAACGGNGAFTNHCDGSLSSGNNGVIESALTASVNYTDMFIHGLASEGIHGATGVGVVADHIHLRGSGFGGIDMDDNPWQVGNISVAGGLTLTNSITEFSGCVQEYPVIHNYPYIECKGQSGGAYGDGFGTASTSGDWFFDHDIWRYNMQDGLDLLHSGMRNLSVTNSSSYGNVGQTYKLGNAKSLLFRNNLALANCWRMVSVIGDEPSSGVSATGELCRAGDNVPLSFTGDGTYVVESNSVGGYMATPFDMSCDWDDCSTKISSTFRNNVIFGYSDSSYNLGQVPGIFVLQNVYGVPFTFMATNSGWTVKDHNTYYNSRTGYCTNNPGTYEVCLTASDPAVFVGMPASPISSEAVLDNFNFAPANIAAMNGAGLYNGANPADYASVTRTNPTSIGAFEFVTGLPQAATPTCNPSPGNYTSAQTVTCSSVTAASTTYCTVDGSTPTTSSPSGNGISISVTKTLNCISSATSYTNSVVASFVYSIGAAVQPFTFGNSVLLGRWR